MKKTLLALVVGACLLASPLWATTFSGTLNTPSSNGTSTLSWSGGPLTGTNGVGGVLTACTSLTCDFYNLTVNVSSTFYSSNPNYSIHVAANWSSSLNDIDLYILDSAGNVVCSSTQGNTNFENADCGQLASGQYTVQIASSTTVNTTYTGQITLAPEPTVGGGRARYKPGNFTFTSPLLLSRPPSVESSAFLEQDAEPRVNHDALGNIFAAAIQAIPAGTDFWASHDGGNTFTYLGQPDGAQAAAAAGADGVGIGGGDEDFAMGPSGKIALSSLWIGSVTNCATSDQGTTWVCNPSASNVPEDDRQWNAWSGSSTVYLTTKNIGALLVGTETIYVVKSTDGGVTFGAPVDINLPEIGLQPGDEGNIITDANGNVYLVFFDSTSTQLWMAKSTDGGQSFAKKLVYQAPTGSSIAHVFPSIAADKSGGLYIVFSDGHNSYLTASANGGANWTTPARVNNSFDSKTAVEPWVVAGDYGKVDVYFYGTSSSDFMDPNASWKIFMAQSLNVFNSLPLITQNAATYVMHHGAICVNGTACPTGTRNLLEYFYPDVYLDGNSMAVFPDDLHVDPTTTVTRAWFIKQTGGSKVTQ